MPKKAPKTKSKEVKTTQNKREFNQEQMCAVRDDYVSGVPISEISRKHKISKHYIQKFCAFLSQERLKNFKCTTKDNTDKSNPRILERMVLDALVPLVQAEQALSKLIGIKPNAYDQITPLVKTRFAESIQNIRPVLKRFKIPRIKEE